MKNPLLTACDFFAFIKTRKNTDNKKIAEELKRFLCPPHTINDLLDLIKVTKEAL